MRSRIHAASTTEELSAEFNYWINYGKNYAANKLKFQGMFNSIEDVKEVFSSHYETTKLLLDFIQSNAGKQHFDMAKIGDFQTGVWLYFRYARDEMEKALPKKMPGVFNTKEFQDTYVPLAQQWHQLQRTITDVAKQAPLSLASAASLLNINISTHMPQAAATPVSFFGSGSKRPASAPLPEKPVLVR